MKSQILLLTLLSLLVGCASVDPSSQRTEVSRKYTFEAVNVNPLRDSVIRGTNCPSSLAQVENKSWRDMVTVAGACAAKGNWSSTEQIGQLLADKFPKSPWGFYFMALSSDSRGDILRAFWLLEQGSNKDKSVAIFPYQKGRILLKNNETENAIVEFEKALKLDPSLYEIDLFLGQIELRNSNTSGASKHFRRVLTYEPFSRDALLGEAKCLSSSGDYKLALDFLERVLSKNAEDSEALYEHAYLLQTMTNNYEQALNEYQNILKIAVKSRNTIVSQNLLEIRIKEVLKLKQVQSSQTIADAKASKRGAK